MDDKDPGTGGGQSEGLWDFFKAVVHAVLVFGSEMWVPTPRMGQALGSFQHRVVRQIMGRQPRRRKEGGWEYTPRASEMEEVGFKEIRVYILKRQNTHAQYIAMQPILNLCKRLVRTLEAWVSRRWWEQEGIDLEGARKPVVAVTER